MRAVLLCLLIGVALVPWPTAPAQTTVEITIEAMESGCPAGKTYCFKETTGKFDSVKPGDVVTINFQNKGQTPHEVSAIDVAKRDAQHKTTKKSEAIASSKASVEGGGNDTFQFTMPADATKLYVWCSVPGHEQLGMWLEQSATATSKSKGSPATGTIGILVALGVALVALGARRQ